MSAFEFEARITTSSERGSAFGRVLHIDKSGATIVSSRELPAGAAVELEMADSIVYGRVLSSRTHDASYQTLIAVRRVALGATELARLLQRVLLEALPETPGLESPEPELD